MSNCISIPNVTLLVTLLSVIGMFRFLGAGNQVYNVSEKTGGKSSNWDTILLPYAPPGFALILLALYFFAGKLFGNDKPKKSLYDAERRTESAFHLDLGKENRSAEENFGKASKERGTTGYNSRSPMPIDRPLRVHRHENNVLKRDQVKQDKAIVCFVR